MKIFFTASLHGKAKYQKDYDLVRESIEQTGVEIISPELGNYKNVLSSAVKRKFVDEQALHYEAIRKGIQAGDAVIIEMSQEDFQLGHEATLAIQAKKHVLCLSVHEDFSKKIHNMYFHGARYNMYNVEELVEEFIAYTKKEQLQERFNCFLSTSQVKYLEQKAKEEAVTMSEYLRQLIDSDRLHG